MSHTHQISGHVDLPVAYLSVEQMEQMLARFGRRPGILLDIDEADQPISTAQLRSEGGEGHEPVPLRRHAVCYMLDEADWYFVTGEISPWGGMICYRR